MAIVIKPITLEVSKPNVFQAIAAKQGDSDSRFIKATISNEGVMIPVLPTSTVTINAKRIDGQSNSFFGEANEDGTAIVPIHSWMLELVGYVNCDVSIIDIEGRKLTTTTFTLLVEEASNISNDVSEEDQYDFIAALSEEVMSRIASKAEQSEVDEIQEEIIEINEKLNTTAGSIEIAQNTGDSETAVMSQKAVSNELTKVDNDIATTNLKIHKNNYCEQLINSADDYLLKNSNGLSHANGTTTGSKYYTTDFIPVFMGEVVKYAMYSASTYSSLCFYDKDKVFVKSEGTSRTTDIKYFSVPEDGFVRLSCHRDYIGVAYAYKMYSSIIERNADIEDVVYASADYHRETASSKFFSMLVAGDIHSSTLCMQNVVSYLNYVDSFDAGIMLGDITSSNFTHDVSFYTSALATAKKPFLTVIGNHDAGNSNDVATSFVNKEDLYNKFVVPNIGYAKLSETENSNEGYYYKDFANYNIRVIVLNQYDHPATMDGNKLLYNRSNSFYSQEQLAWFVNALNTAPINYHILIALHSAPDSMNKDFSSHFTSYARGTTHLYDHSCISGQPIVEIVNAWINGATLNKTYNLRKEHESEATGETITVNADFASRGNGVLIGYISGHWHGSYISHSDTFPNQMMYSVDCAAPGSGATEDSDTPRKVGTKSEDCFVAFSVDTANRKINIVRIGARMTNTMVDRFVTQISY